MFLLVACLGDEIDSRYAFDPGANPFGPQYVLPKEGVDIRKENSIYAAIEHMKPLVEIERRLMNIIPVDLLDRWINERSDLSAFAVSVREFGKYVLEYDQDLDQYLGNPINCYTIIKRFTNGWILLPYRNDVDSQTKKGIQGVLKVNFMYLPSVHVDLLGECLLLKQKNYIYHCGGCFWGP